MSKNLSIVSPECRFRGKCDTTDHAALPRWEEKYSRKCCSAQAGDRLVLWYQPDRRSNQWQGIDEGNVTKKTKPYGRWRTLALMIHHLHLAPYAPWNGR